MNGSVTPVEWRGAWKSYRFHRHVTPMILVINYRKVRIEYRITRETRTEKSKWHRKWLTNCLTEQK